MTPSYEFLPLASGSGRTYPWMHWCCPVGGGCFVLAVIVWPGCSWAKACVKIRVDSHADSYVDSHVDSHVDSCVDSCVKSGVDSCVKTCVDSAWMFPPPYVKKCVDSS